MLLTEETKHQLRLTYAGLAMQGLLAAPDLSDSSVSEVAGWAVKYTDALIKELEATE